jgi:16S rRNA (cytosine967-C5)-methyltransferase
VLVGHNTLDQALEANAVYHGLDARDQRFARLLVSTVLRHRGDIAGVLKPHLSRPLPRKSGMTLLLLETAIAQLQYLGTPAHAAISAAVELAKADRNARHFAGLTNAILRKAAAEMDGDGRMPAEPSVNLPSWLWQELVTSHGKAVASAIARAHLEEAPLDLTPRQNAKVVAERVSGTLLPNGTIRLTDFSGSVTALPGFGEGDWWVQDVAASLPATLLGDVAGQRVADLCAAPGGKTAQLAARGASVVAIDSSAERLKRLVANLARLKLAAELHCADILAIDESEAYDAVLLDAPCSATGTIRRHPELPWIRSLQQVSSLVDLQGRMLDRAALLVRPGGLLVFCTCSLLRQEGEDQAVAFLDRHPSFELLPVMETELGGMSGLISAEGFLRTHPGLQAAASGGMDGFFAARFRKTRR